VLQHDPQAGCRRPRPGRPAHRFAGRRSRLVGDAEDDLAAPVVAQASRKCLAGVGEWEDLVDRRPQLAMVGKLGKVGELVAVWFDDEVDGADRRLGRVLGGWPATETSLPPARRTAGERSSRPPPAVSNTRSTASMASSKRAMVWSMTWLAPSSSAVWTFPVDAVPITSAPRVRASWTARSPTPPAAPWISTRCPSLSWPWSNRPCQALSPASGIAAVSTWPSWRGFGARSPAGTTMYSAAAPSRSKPLSA
jgi:hypothetical protein